MNQEEAVGLDMVGEVLSSKQQEEEDDDLKAFQELLKQKKKKKPKKTKDNLPSETAPSGDNSSNDNTNQNNNAAPNASNTVQLSETDYWRQDDTRDYPYTMLLDRIFQQLKSKNPSLIDRTQHILPPPQLGFVGSKRTLWSNFKDTGDLLQRKLDHIKEFFFIRNEYCW